MKHSILTVTIAVLFSASASAQNSSEASASGSLKDKLAVASARADANARTVKRMAASPSSLELSVGDSIISSDLWSRIKHSRNN